MKVKIILSLIVTRDHYDAGKKSPTSGKLSKKGGRAGSGWLMLVAIKPAHQPSLDHVAADH